MPFKSPLRVELVYEGEQRCIWKLTDPLVYSGAGLEITVPVGFQTDFASIPRRVLEWQLWFQFGGKFNAEAVIHDYLYRIDSVPNMGQGVADNHLLFMLEESRRYSHTFCAMVHSAVSDFGSGSFHRFRVADPLPKSMVD